MRWLLCVSLPCALGAAACVPEQEHVELQHQLGRVVAERDSFRSRYQDERAKATMLAEHLNAAAGDRDLSRAEVDALRSQIARLEADNRELHALIEGQAKRPLERPAVDVASLPTSLDAALLGLAERFPQQIVYERARAAVRFAADLLFEPGSDALLPAARPALTAFAQVAAAPEVAEYEVVVVGHTDDAPIARPETLERHPTNRHLSVHRAIAVANALADAGLPQARIAVMGYGPHRPLGADPARNRRVEVFLVRKGDVRPLGGA